MDEESRHRVIFKQKMAHKTGRTSRIAATVLLGVNFVVMLFCIILFAFSLWMISSASTLSAALQNIHSPVLRTLLHPHVLTVALGVALAALAGFLFFVSFMGFYGALTRSPFLLFMYSTLVLLLLLLECALLYYFSSSLIEKGLQEQDGQWTHALRLAFKCCEHNTTHMLPHKLSKLPWSCCSTAGYPENCTAPQVFDKNCHHTITSWLHRYSTAIYASLAVVHIGLSSCSLLRRARSASHSHS